MNPFRYGAIARGEHFADRAVELRRLLEDVMGGQDVVIVSPRRMGKTSLVTRAIDRLRRDGVLVAYVDLLGSPTKEELADDLAQALYDGLYSRSERALGRVREVFAHLQVNPRVTVGEDGRPQLEFVAYEQTKDLNALIEGLLEVPGRAAASDKRVCIVIDEFQEVVSIDERLPGQIRAAFQRQPDVAHVYLGSRRHLMDELFMERAAPLYRSAKPLPLGPIPPRLFIRFLRRRFESGGIKIEDEPLEQVLALTGGRPYETQELCSFLWARSREEGRAPDGAMVERALDDLVNAESARYVAVWERLSAKQRSLLLALGRESGRVHAEQYRRRHKLGSASTVQASLNALERLELVEPVEPGGGYQVADVFLSRWLRRID